MQHGRRIPSSQTFCFTGRLRSPEMYVVFELVEQLGMANTKLILIPHDIDSIAWLSINDAQNISANCPKQSHRI